MTWVKVSCGMTLGYTVERPDTGLAVGGAGRVRGNEGGRMKSPNFHRLGGFNRLHDSMTDVEKVEYRKCRTNGTPVL